MMTNFHHCEELEDLNQDLPRFIEQLEALATRLGLKLAQLEIDHIAVRCHQSETAERWERGLLKAGQLFSTNNINGRQISLFLLTTPLQILNQQIDMIELPWPGKRHWPREGWEHIEVVLRGEEQQLYQRAMALFSDQALQQPGISVKTSHPRGESERLANPTLAVTDGKITIKFHPRSLREIVMSERGDR